MDVLHQNSLVLEHVTLGLRVEFTVQTSVNLLGLPKMIIDFKRDLNILNVN